MGTASSGSRPGPRRVHLRGAAASRRQYPTPGHRTRHPALQSARTAAEAPPDPRQAPESRGGRELAITWRPARPHWLRPSQWRRSPAAAGPEAAAPARARSPCYALSNSPRYSSHQGAAVLVVAAAAARGAPGSSAALRGGSRGRGRGSRVQGAARPPPPRRASGSSSSRTPQVMLPPRLRLSRGQRPAARAAPPRLVRSGLRAGAGDCASGAALQPTRATPAPATCPRRRGPSGGCGWDLAGWGTRAASGPGRALASVPEDVPLSAI